MAIKKDSFVSMHFVLKDNEGKIIDSSQKDEPIDFIFGYDFLVKGLDKALEGKKKGDSFDVVISPEEGYGVKNEQLVYQIDSLEFGDLNNELLVGQELQMEQEDGSFIVRVTSIDGDKITLDGNHPLADKTLHFSIEILEEREAEEDEIKTFLDYLENGCDCDDDCGDDCHCH